MTIELINYAMQYPVNLPNTLEKPSGSQVNAGLNDKCFVVDLNLAIRAQKWFQ